MAHALATRHDTPVGPFAIVTNEAAAVLGAGFTLDETRLLAPIHPTLRPSALVWRDGATGSTTPADEALRHYLDGDLAALDTVEVAWQAEPFRDRAWQAMRNIRPGQPISYRELAVAAGGSGWEAARAAGQACARNPVSLFLP